MIAAALNILGAVYVTVLAAGAFIGAGYIAEWLLNKWGRNGKDY